MMNPVIQIIAASTCILPPSFYEVTHAVVLLGGESCLRTECFPLIRDIPIELTLPPSQNLVIVHRYFQEGCYPILLDLTHRLIHSLPPARLCSGW